MFEACTLYFCFEMNKCQSNRVEWESLLRKRTYNMQCTIFTDTLNFISTSDPFSTEQSTAQKMFSGKNIRCRYRYCVYRALHWNISVFFSFLLYGSLSLVDVVGFCVVPTESGRQQRQQHREIFSVWIWMYCEKYIKAYIETRQNETNSDERAQHFSIRQIDFCFTSWDWVLGRRKRRAEACRSRFESFFITVVFSFTSKHIKITSSIDSIQSQTVTVEFKNIGAKMMGIVCRSHISLAVQQLARFPFQIRTTTFLLIF